MYNPRVLIGILTLHFSRILVLQNHLLTFGIVLNKKDTFFCALCRSGGLWLKRRSSFFFCQQYTFNVTRDIIRSLTALEFEIVELQHLETTEDRGHIEALRKKKATMNNLLGIAARGSRIAFLTLIPKRVTYTLEELVSGFTTVRYFQDWWG